MAVRAYWKGSLGCFCRHCEERLVRRSSTSEGGSDEAIHLATLTPDCFAEPVTGRALTQPSGADPLAGNDGDRSACCWNTRVIAQFGSLIQESSRGPRRKSSGARANNEL